MNKLKCTCGNVEMYSMGKEIRCVTCGKIIIHDIEKDRHMSDGEEHGTNYMNE